MKCHVRILAGLVDRACGSHVYNQILARRLAERGHRVSLLCFRATSEVLDFAEVFELAPVPYQDKRFVWRFTHVLQHRHFNRSMKGLTLPPADVVVGAELLFLKAHRRLFPNTPWIYVPHSFVVTHEIRGAGFVPSMRLVAEVFYQHLQRWALNHADRTLRFTRLACEALERHYGPSVHPRFVVNPQGIDIPDVPARGRVSGSVRLLWVGQLIPRKRIDVAIGALTPLKHLDWRFDVVGDGPLRGVLEDQVVAAGLADRVTFHGFRNDPSRFYQGADLLLFPSLSENSPMTMWESMSYGVPCLAMQGDGVQYHNANAEIIDAGVDGFLAKTDDDYRLQLGHLLMQPGLLQEAGERARQKIIDRHSWEQHVDRYEAIFDELTSVGAGREDTAKTHPPGGRFAAAGVGDGHSRLMPRSR